MTRKYKIIITGIVEDHFDRKNIDEVYSHMLTRIGIMNDQARLRDGIITELDKVQVEPITE
jgi:hypothetical protein